MVDYKQKIMSKSNTTDDDFSMKVALGIWFCLCVFSAIWAFMKFSNGRYQLQRNLHVVEDSLRLMQERIDLEQRKKSIGYVETLDEITKAVNRCPNEEDKQKVRDENECEATKEQQTEKGINEEGKQENEIVEQQAAAVVSDEIKKNL